MKQMDFLIKERFELGDLECESLDEIDPPLDFNFRDIHDHAFWELIKKYFARKEELMNKTKVSAFADKDFAKK